MTSTGPWRASPLSTPVNRYFAERVVNCFSFNLLKPECYPRQMPIPLGLTATAVPMSQFSSARTGSNYVESKTTCYPSVSPRLPPLRKACPRQPYSIKALALGIVNFFELPHFHSASTSRNYLAPYTII